MKHLGLFEGIGGFSLAARWAGWTTPVMVEWNKYCQAVLKKNFPDAIIFGDINEFDGRPYAGQIDVLTGGFPCQPYSHAGKRAGNDDDRALWPQMLRVIREIKPAWIVGENVAGILSMDGGRVLAGILSDLENAGYSPEIYSIPAIGVGAPHERERVWIVAHRDDFQCDRSGRTRGRRDEFTDQNNGVIAHCDAGTSAIPIQPQGKRNKIENTYASGQNSGVTSDADGKGIETRNNKRGKQEQENGATVRNWSCAKSITTPHANLQRCTEQFPAAKPGFAGFCSGDINSQWSEHWLPAATRLCRVDDGIPAGVDGIGDVSGKAKKRKATGKGHRIEALGNAIVPHIAFQIFQAINEYETR